MLKNYFGRFYFRALFLSEIKIVQTIFANNVVVIELGGGGGGGGVGEVETKWEGRLRFEQIPPENLLVCFLTAKIPLLPSVVFYLYAEMSRFVFVVNV